MPKIGLNDYGEKGKDAYVVFCRLQGERRDWLVTRTRTETETNGGEPWSCKDANGLTGFIGMKIFADSPEDAKEKMEKVRQNYIEAKERPEVWS